MKKVPRKTSDFVTMLKSHIHASILESRLEKKVEKLRAKATGRPLQSFNHEETADAL
jgi:hypothetical protein